MIKARHIALYFLAFLASSISFSQTVKEIVSKMQSNYAQQDYLEYNMVYEMYKGHRSKIVHESYNGYCYKNGSKLYQKINSTEFIYTTEFSLKVNMDERAMVLYPGQKKSALGEMNLEQALRECKEQKLETFETYYVVSLILNDHSLLPISLVTLKIDRKKHTLLQMDIYYTDNIDFSTDYTKVDYYPPHLRIKFANLNMNPKRKDNLFLLDKYLSIKGKGVYQPTGEYKDFEFYNDSHH